MEVHGDREAMGHITAVFSRKCLQVKLGEKDTGAVERKVSLETYAVRCLETWSVVKDNGVGI